MDKVTARDIIDRRLAFLADSTGMSPSPNMLDVEAAETLLGVKAALPLPVAPATPVTVLPAVRAKAPKAAKAKAAKPAPKKASRRSR